jgi:hypothetical protein
VVLSAANFELTIAGGNRSTKMGVLKIGVECFDFCRSKIDFHPAPPQVGFFAYFLAETRK